MANKPVLRSYIRLQTTKVLNEDWDGSNGDNAGYPVHFAGMAAFLRNAAQTETAQVFVDESADGATWTPVLFSTPTNSGNLSVTLQPLAYELISFESSQQYVRLRLANEVEEGVYAYCVQYPPISRAPVTETYA
jgi:hypothetical protein